MYGGNNCQHQELLFRSYNHFSGHKGMFRLLVLLATVDCVGSGQS